MRLTKEFEAVEAPTGQSKCPCWNQARVSNQASFILISNPYLSLSILGALMLDYWYICCCAPFHYGFSIILLYYICHYDLDSFGNGAWVINFKFGNLGWFVLWGVSWQVYYFMWLFLLREFKSWKWKVVLWEV